MRNRDTATRLAVSSRAHTHRPIAAYARFYYSDFSVPRFRRVHTGENSRVSRKFLGMRTETRAIIRETRSKQKKILKILIKFLPIVLPGCSTHGVARDLKPCTRNLVGYDWKYSSIAPLYISFLFLFSVLIIFIPLFFTIY